MTSGADTAGDRHRYLEEGLVPLTCGRCGTEVGVRKSTDVQTSVQWAGSARDLCPVIAEQVARGRHPGLVDGCPDLRASVAAAVASGAVTVAPPP